MPADSKESTPMEVDVSESSKTPKRSTKASAATPKTDTKKPVQAKLSAFFTKSTPKADGMKSPKKEVQSPEKETRTSPRKSQGGKKEDKNEKKKEEKKKEETKKKEIKKEIKKEVKEEPMSDADLMGDDSDNEDEDGSDVGVYEVEKILSHKWKERQQINGEWVEAHWEYEVKWLGFKDEENTFESAANLDTAKIILKDYIDSLPEAEQEKINGKKKTPAKERPSKRPHTETQTKEKEAAEKKKKETVVTKKDKPATPAANKSVKDSRPIAKIFQKSQKANAAKKAVKEEDNFEENVQYIKDFRDKAVKYADPGAEESVGPLGLVFEKAATLLIDMMESNADPEKMRSANELLKKERSEVQPNDKVEEDRELRDVIYGVIESMETAFDFIIKREEDILNPPATGAASIVASDTDSSAVKTEVDTDSLFAVSTAVVKKEGEMGEKEVKMEA